MSDERKPSNEVRESIEALIKAKADHAKQLNDMTEDLLANVRVRYNALIQEVNQLSADAYEVMSAMTSGTKNYTEVSNMTDTLDDIEKALEGRAHDDE